VLCDQRTVTTNEVRNEYGVFNGAATFMTLAENVRRPHEVQFELPAEWTRVMTGLDDVSGGRAARFRAPDYETLVDSPILAGDLGVREFVVAGKTHYVVTAGDTGAWDGDAATRALATSVGARSPQKRSVSLMTRAGLRSAQEYVASLSSLIGGLENAPGRRLQSVEQSSREVWGNSNSGVNPNVSTVSYYNKGNVLGLLLDARIRRVTQGRGSLDDVMRLAYRRYSGERGFTADEFRRTAEEVAGVDLREWFRRSVSTTEDLDYSDVLEWYGLRFTAGEGITGSWQLEPRPDGTDAQRARVQAWLQP
jgi:predicted metalloprotease with PDZ domain